MSDDLQLADPGKTTPSIAIIGLGQMGRGIARNLDAKGFLCAAGDVTPGAFAAAKFSDRVTEAKANYLPQNADIILFAVPSINEIEGLLAKSPPRRGQTIVDLTTSAPNRGRALAEELSKSGVAYVDAAMTGGAAGADAGTLSLMVGVSAQDLAACRLALEAIAIQIFHLGDVSSGQAMKLVHNMILHTSFLANCEGLRLAESAGLDVSAAVEVLNAGNARSFVSEVRFPCDILSGTMMARSQISNLQKDLALAEGFARTLEARIPFGTMTTKALTKALDMGHRETDFSWLFPLYEDIADQMEDIE